MAEVLEKNVKSRTNRRAEQLEFVFSLTRPVAALPLSCMHSITFQIIMQVSCWMTALL